jgi:hypothetical protein
MQTDQLAAVSCALKTIITAVTNNPRSDPRKLKPGQLLQVLNSTPMGSVLDDRRLRQLRASDGLKFGDGKTIDIVRFIGHLAGKRHLSPDAPAEDPRDNDASDAYQRKKDRERERNAASSRSGRDIAPLPVVRDPERRARVWDSLLAFCEYFPDRFILEFSDDHLQLIDALQKTIIDGRLHAFALTRGSDKATICEVAVICGPSR